MNSGLGGLRQLSAWTIATLRPEKNQVTILFGMVLGNAFLGGVADPMAVKFLIDSLSKHDLHRFLVVALVALLLYTALRQLSAYIERLTQSVVAAVSQRLLISSLSAFYRLPYEDVVLGDSGYFVSRICDESIQLAAVVQLVSQLLSAVALFFGAAAVCLWLSWKTSIILSLMVPILRIAAVRYQRRISDAVVEETEYEARLKEVLGRAVESYRTVNLFGLLKTVEAQTHQYMRRFLDATKRQVKYSAAFKALSGTLLSYAELSVFVAAGIAVLQRVLSIGGLFGFVSAYGRVVGSIESLTSMIPAVTSLDAKRRRLDSLLQATVAPVATEEGTIQVVVAEGISLNRHDAPVLQKCSIRVALGERLLLRGPNGSGKTTLAHVLCGFLRVHEGYLRLPQLNRISALLSPHCFVPGSFEDNLASTLQTESDRERFRILTNELDLKIGLAQDPSQLSEGEKRKCQIIMTLMKDADFYIFDEPLANIDTGSSKAVVNAIMNHTQGKALVMIMHGGEEYRSLFDKELELSRLDPKVDPGATSEGNEEQLIYE